LKYGVKKNAGRDVNKARGVNAKAIKPRPENPKAKKFGLKAKAND